MVNSMFKKLKKMLDEKELRKKELAERSKVTEDVKELRSINTEMDSVNKDIEELRSMITALPKDPEVDGQAQRTQVVNGAEAEGIEQRGAGTFIPYQAANFEGEQRSTVDDIYSTVEYRMAFKDYIINGTPIPDKFKNEQRSDALTTVSDVAAVIPTNIQSKVIEDMTVEGKILGRVAQTAFQGGIQIPISEINITATWLESEESASDEQKAKMEAKLTFGYHVLEAKVAIGLLSSTVSLTVFESTVVKQLKKAMIRALETSIIVGTGSGQPLGITKYTLPTEQVITMTGETIGTVKKWAEVEAAVPEAYEESLIYMMSKATWEKYLNGMTDTTGQKIGLGKINEKGQKILNGREVLTTDTFPSFDAASSGAVWGCLVDLSQYCLNSNLSMYYKKYFNEDKNKWIHKALMIADGKMPIGTVGEVGSEKLVGAKGLIYLKK